MRDSDNSERFNSCNPIAVCASSARWLAQSANAAGFTVNALDQFGDWDLQQVCQEWVRIGSERELTTLIDRQSTQPLLIGAGLESMLDDFRKLANSPNWRNATVQSIELARDPFFCAKELNTAGYETAAITASRPKCNQGLWLNKSGNSTGGQGVNWGNSLSATQTGYWQKFIPGQAFSSLHLASDTVTETFGLFLQLIGNYQSDASGFDRDLKFADEIFGAKPFHFAGAIGPLNDSNLEQFGLLFSQAINIAAVIANVTGLRGVFGIDWILNPESRLIPIEINPRFTATAELWEQATLGNMVTSHLNAIGNENQQIPTAETTMGKAILFNSGNDFVVDKQLHQKLVGMCQAGNVADVPCAGACIQAGSPIATLFSHGFEGAEFHLINKRLVELAQEIRQALPAQSQVRYSNA